MRPPAHIQAAVPERVRSLSPAVVKSVNRLVNGKADIETARGQLALLCRDHVELGRAVDLFNRWAEVAAPTPPEHREGDAVD